MQYTPRLGVIIAKDCLLYFVMSRKPSCVSHRSPQQVLFHGEVLAQSTDEILMYCTIQSNELASEKEPGLTAFFVM